MANEQDFQDIGFFLMFHPAGFLSPDICFRLSGLHGPHFPRLSRCLEPLRADFEAWGSFEEGGSVRMALLNSRTPRVQVIFLLPGSRRLGSWYTPEPGRCLAEQTRDLVCR